MTTPTTNKHYYVGRYTAGICLILGGALYIVSLFTDLIRLNYALKLWPLIFIGVGIELLVSAVRSKGERIHYDWLSVVLVFLMTGCAMTLLFMDYVTTFMIK